MLFLKAIYIKDKKIETVKQWPEPQSVQDIQVFLGFANFYRQFIQNFNRIATLLTSILKTSSTKLAELRKDVVGVVGDSKTRCNRDEFNRNMINDAKVNGGKVRDDEVEKKSQKTLKNLSKSKKTGGSDFLIFGARLAFTKLRQTFVKAPIFHHFEPEYHIRVGTDESGYAIGGVLSQLNSHDLGRRHPVAFFS